jgi:hypothetical protein
VQEKTTRRIHNAFSSSHVPSKSPILNICLDDIDRFSDEQQDEIIEIVRDPARVEAEAVDEDDAEQEADAAEPVAED